MCLIVDNNTAHQITLRSNDAIPIIRALDKRQVTLATGGKHLDELMGNSIRRLLIELLRNGRARNFTGSELEKKTEQFSKSTTVVSDDPHILALAIVSGARVLYTQDRDLITDFRNPRNIKKPRGAIYSTFSNANLLKRCKAC